MSATFAVAKFDDAVFIWKPTGAGCVEILLDGIDHEKRRAYCLAHAREAIRLHLNRFEYPRGG